RCSSTCARYTCSRRIRTRWRSSRGRSRSKRRWPRCSTSSSSRRGASLRCFRCCCSCGEGAEWITAEYGPGSGRFPRCHSQEERDMMKAAILSALALSLPAFAAQDGAPLRATLMGYQEVPSVSSKADGEFEARIAADGQSFDYTLAYDGLQADVLMSHIHFAQKSVNGPIIVWLCGTTTNPGPAGTETCPGRDGTHL